MRLIDSNGNEIMSNGKGEITIAKDIPRTLIIDHGYLPTNGAYDYSPNFIQESGKHFIINKILIDVEGEYTGSAKFRFVVRDITDSKNIVSGIISTEQTWLDMVGMIPENHVFQTQVRIQNSTESLLVKIVLNGFQMEA